MARRERSTGSRSNLVVDVATGWLVPVRRVESPNCDSRPPDAATDLIVIHGISLPPGEFGGPWIDRLFTNTLPPDQHPYFAEVAPKRVSAHLLVDRRGIVTQYVPFHLRAWHAGSSSFAGRDACNDFSIGIELEGSDFTPYEERQYHVLAYVIGVLCGTYPALSPMCIVGHSEIAPGRKTDPGPAFDWPRLKTLVALETSTSPGY
jgi:AmpD protein